MRVRWLRRALNNLDEEAAFIAQDSPKSAAAFVAHVLASAAMLAAQPQMGRPGRVPGTRELVVTRFPYILPYRVREQNVEILRVFHAARKWPQRFAE
jgi:plasmid stabilization system protein ParE